MAYDWLISEGNSVPFVASLEISAGEWVLGSGSDDTVVPASVGSDALGIAATDAYDDATPGTANKQVAVYMSGLVKTIVHASADVNIGDDLEIEDKVTLVNAGGSNVIVAQACDFLASGSTSTIRVRICRKSKA